MIIEPMQPKYMDQVIALHENLIGLDIRHDQSEVAFRKIRNNEDYYLAVAREGEEILGTVTGICCQGLGERFLVLEDLVVKEGLRGGGIGTALMAAMDDFGRARGCTYVFLVSSGFRKQAHKFYEKLGYTEDVRGFRKPIE